MQQCHFDFGEQKFVGIKIKSMTKSPLTVENAAYSLTCGDDEETTGECTLEQFNDYTVIVKALINPLRANTIYELRFTYDIGPEHFEYPVKVRVTL